MSEKFRRERLTIYNQPKADLSKICVLYKPRALVYRPKQTNKNSEANINHVLDITLFHRSFYWSYISRPNPLLNFLFIHFHIPLQIPNRKGSIYFGINDRKSNQFHCHISDFKILIVDELQYNDTLPRVLLMNFIPSFKMSDNMYFVIVPFTVYPEYHEFLQYRMYHWYTYRFWSQIFHSTL